MLSDALVRRAGSPGMAARHRRRRALFDEIRRGGSLSTSAAATLLDAPPALARGLLYELVGPGWREPRGERAPGYHVG